MEQLEAFRHQVRGWMCDPHSDGDYCPTCWPRHLEKLEAVQPGLSEIAKADAIPLSDPAMAESRVLSDGWGVWCEMCSASVFVAKAELKAESAAA